jgi:hypothetical protein
MIYILITHIQKISRESVLLKHHRISSHLKERLEEEGKEEGNQENNSSLAIIANLKLDPLVESNLCPVVLRLVPVNI